MKYHWFNEPQRIRIKLNKNYRNDILKKLKQYGGPCAISRKVGVSSSTICHYFQDQGMTIGSIKNICNLLEISFEELEKNITEIKKVFFLQVTIFSWIRYNIILFSYCPRLNFLQAPIPSHRSRKHSIRFGIIYKMLLIWFPS